jgi:hypothetical protein
MALWASSNNPGREELAGKVAHLSVLARILLIELLVLSGGIPLLLALVRSSQRLSMWIGLERMEPVQMETTASESQTLNAMVAFAVAPRQLYRRKVPM